MARRVFGRAAGAARRFALGQNRGFGSILDPAEKIAGDGFEKLPLNVTFALAPSAQSLENPHRILR
ncbi:hypothetical protein [Bradyrhizobium sp. RDI18]|uniref:hypothetical protein n=1 Tax=Bradyrhizobium sp. RDI18 TaxID=3367400 RepID=UPI003710D744